VPSKSTVVIYRQHSSPVRISNVVSFEDDVNTGVINIEAIVEGSYSPQTQKVDYKKTYKFYRSQILGYMRKTAIDGTEEEIT
jgi:hypothetical protein